jgi:hypothetical protein
MYGIRKANMHITNQRVPWKFADGVEHPVLQALQF